jgi:hypothetical protein
LLIPSRQGLSPCKIRRALLGAITAEIRRGPKDLPRQRHPRPFPSPELI